MNEIIFTEASQPDSSAIDLIFRSAVLNTPDSGYTESQLKAWATKKHLLAWEKPIEEQYFIKATLSNEILGFASLSKDGLIDYLFVHPDFQGKGIARMLYKILEQRALDLKISYILSFASCKAKHFFESVGFEFQHKNRVVIGDVQLENSLMIKRL